MLDISTHPLLEAAWLAAHLSDADVRIVDARWRGDGTSRELYQRGHIPGAIHLDWYHDLSWTDARGVRNLLLPPESFAAGMEAAGIGDHTRVVAYAEMDHSGAARLWWALRFYGHDQVAVLNGGLEQVGRCRIACQHRSASPFAEKVHTPTLSSVARNST